MGIASRPITKGAVCVACMLAFAVFPVCAQNPWGMLRGVVRDPSGARIPLAGVSVRRVGSGEERKARTDKQGEFQFSDLTPGSYEVQVSSPGFASADSNVRVVISAAQDIAVVL